MSIRYKGMLKEFFKMTHSYREDYVNQFTLSSGEQSPYYVDCRKLLAYPHIRRTIGEIVEEILVDSSFDCVGGLESGAISFAQIVSDQTKVGMFYVRKSGRDHGTKKMIEGYIYPGGKALIVDDVFTTGNSILKAAEAARQYGLTVTEALVIVDRSADYIERALFKGQHGIKVHSIMTIKELGGE